MRGSGFGKFVWMSVVFYAAVADAAPITCNAADIDPLSYELTTAGVARLDDFRSTAPAERALLLDSGNLLAHGHLARQYLIAGEDASYTEASWRAVLNNGGAVVWTATLYDVDAKSFFLMAFDREALRIYRYGELAGAYETRLGVPEIVGQDRERFWRALGGCLDPLARPEAVIPWSQVREIKSGNWVHYFKLTAPVVVTSDRGKRKTLSEIKVNLHGGTGTVEYLVTRDALEPWNPYRANVRGIGMGPLPYQERVRHTLVKFVDPAGRIALPKASKSAGW
jgi:hypothetical protein